MTANIFNANEVARVLRKNATSADYPCKIKCQWIGSIFAVVITGTFDFRAAELIRSYIRTNFSETLNCSSSVITLYRADFDAPPSGMLLNYEQR